MKKPQEWSCLMIEKTTVASRQVNMMVIVTVMMIVTLIALPPKKVLPPMGLQALHQACIKRNESLRNCHRIAPKTMDLLILCLVPIIHLHQQWPRQKSKLLRQLDWKATTHERPKNLWKMLGIHNQDMEELESQLVGCN